MNTLKNIIQTASQYKHHALLLIAKQFEDDSILESYFASIAEEFCGIKIYRPENNLVYDIAINHPDIFIANRQRKTLRLEDLHKIQELCLYPPTNGRRRLFFIENCERMNPNAANALLKVLEEPQAQALFLLSTKNLKLIPPTIASRCQKVFVQFPVDSKNNIFTLITKEDYNLIQQQIECVSLNSEFLSHSLAEKTIKTTSLANLKKILSISEKLAKEYSPQILIDSIVLATQDMLRKNPNFISISRFILANLSEWKNAEVFNTSTQLWLIRIFLGFQLKSF